MKYWLTTHWPPLSHGAAIPLGVWLEVGKAGAADGMERGDLLLIYQVEDGPALLKKYAGEPVVEIQRFRGRKGIVTLAEMLDKPSDQDERDEESYSDGRKKLWQYFAPARPINSAGFVPFREVQPLVGSLRAIGKQHSGLKELSKDVFERLSEKFLASTLGHDAATLDRISRYGGFGTGGEGPAHLALKTAIAEDPSRILGEAGLTLWELEYGLPTADRIDIVLKDRFGRFVVVEVEVDCAQAEIIGPLQCMKYRAMMSYLYQRPAEEVRAVLAAHTIHESVEATCKEFGIECRSIDRRCISVSEPTRSASAPAVSSSSSPPR